MRALFALRGILSAICGAVCHSPVSAPLSSSFVTVGIPPENRFLKRFPCTI